MSSPGPRRAARSASVSFVSSTASVNFADPSASDPAGWPGEVWADYMYEDSEDSSDSDSDSDSDSSYNYQTNQPSRPRPASIAALDALANYQFPVLPRRLPIESQANGQQQARSLSSGARATSESHGVATAVAEKHAKTAIFFSPSRSPSPSAQPASKPHDATEAGKQAVAKVSRKKVAGASKFEAYTALEVTAELFAHFELAAKKWVLDPLYPERRQCLTPTKTATMAEKETNSKNIELELDEFLNDEGWGERCWGKDVVGVDGRTLTYPDNTLEIINRLVPLMQRLVKNEKQRLYAFHNRSKEPTNKKKRKYNKMSTSPEGDDQSSPGSVTLAGVEPPNPVTDVFYVSILRGEEPFAPPRIIYIPQQAASPLATIAVHVDSYICYQGLDVAAVKILTSTGLTEVHHNEDWDRAMKDIREHSLMIDKAIEVVVDLKEQTEVGEPEKGEPGNGEPGNEEPAKKKLAKEKPAKEKPAKGKSAKGKSAKEKSD